jgi:hypothetical protein
MRSLTNLYSTLGHFVFLTALSTPTLALEAARFDRMLQNLENKAHDVPRAAAAIADYKNVETGLQAEKGSFLNTVQEFKSSLQSQEGKKFVRSMKRACTSAAAQDQEKCSQLRARWTAWFKRAFQGQYIHFGGLEEIADRFVILSGYRIREYGSADAFAGLIPTRLGLGFAASRSLASMMACTLPYSGNLLGLEASAVVGVGVQTGIFVGAPGICFEVSIMKGFAAYGAITLFYLQGPGEQMQMQMQGDELNQFPAAHREKKRRAAALSNLKSKS